MVSTVEREIYEERVRRRMHEKFSPNIISAGNTHAFVLIIERSLPILLHACMLACNYMYIKKLKVLVIKHTRLKFLLLSWHLPFF